MYEATIHNYKYVWNVNTDIVCLFVCVCVYFRYVFECVLHAPAHLLTAQRGLFSKRKCVLINAGDREATLGVLIKLCYNSE